VLADADSGHAESVYTPPSYIVRPIVLSIATGNVIRFLALMISSYLNNYPVVVLRRPDFTKNS